jgi:hypothetical protein
MFKPRFEDFKAGYGTETGEMCMMMEHVQHVAYIYIVYIIHMCMYIKLVLQSASSCLCRKTYNLVMEPHCLQDAIGNRTKHCLFGNAEAKYYGLSLFLPSRLQTTRDIWSKKRVWTDPYPQIG